MRNLSAYIMAAATMVAIDNIHINKGNVTYTVKRSRLSKKQAKARFASKLARKARKISRPTY